MTAKDHIQRRTGITLVLLAVTGVLAGGCATSMNIPSYAYRAGLPGEIACERAGAKMVVEPFFDRERSEQYFQVDGFARDLAILYVRVENKSMDTSYLLQKDGIRLIFSTNVFSGTQTLKENSGFSDAVMLTGAALVSLPLLFIGGGMNTHVERVQHNFAIKELRTQSVAPNSVAEGFVYFQMAKKPIAGASMLLTVPLVNTLQGQTNEMQLNITYERTKR